MELHSFSYVNWRKPLTGKKYEKIGLPRLCQFTKKARGLVVPGTRFWLYMDEVLKAHHCLCGFCGRSRTGRKQQDPRERMEVGSAAQCYCVRRPEGHLWLRSGRR
jgi:hypothetical protein